MKKLLLSLAAILFLFFTAFSQDCNIWDTEADILPCNEAGYFYVLLDFEYENVGDNGFRVQGNGNNYGNFEYGNVPVEIGPLLGDGTTIYEFVVIDNEIEGCSDWTAIDPVDCSGGGGECAIWDVWADIQPCNDAGYFYVLLDFEYENVGEEGFRVQGNGNNYGNFEYGDLPVEIGPLLGDGSSIYEFVVIDNQVEGCSDWTAIDPVDCFGGGGECDLGELIIEVLPCNDEGMFNVEIDFEYINTSAFFQAYANDIYFGPFEYADLPVELGPLEGDGETVYNFFVVDGEIPSCHEWAPIEPVDCDGTGGECEIGELQVEFLGCNDAGYYSVSLDFEFANVSDQGFLFYLNDGLYGDYLYSDLPITVEGLAGDGETQYDFYVRDIAFEECSNWRWVGPEECDGWGGGSNCAIWDVWADVNPCNDEGYFTVFLGFEYENVGENGFSVQGNGTDYGDFEYADLPVEIGPLLGDGTTVYEFGVSDNTFEGCSDWTEIDPVDCDVKGEGEWIQVFPNPSTSATSIKFHPTLSGKKDIYIYDPNGELVLEVKGFENQVYKTDGSFNKKGIYLYKVYVDGVELGGKLLIN